jgi:hypothetical protein
MDTNSKTTYAFFKKCLLRDRLSFKHSHCLLTISLDSNNHEAERLRATIRLVNNMFDIPKRGVCYNDSMGK